MAFHGKPPYTGDFDIFFRPSRDNAERFLAALKQFGDPTAHLSREDLETRGRQSLSALRPGESMP